MTLRLTVLAALAVVPLASSSASAQSARSAQVPFTRVETLDGQVAPASSLAASSSAPLAACGANVTDGQAFTPDITFIDPTGNTAGTGGTPLEYGQSFTAPCDGFLDTFTIGGNPATANQTVAFTLLFYAGAGTSGTLLATTSASFGLPSTGSIYNLPVPIDAFPVTQGQVYTVFIDVTSANFNLGVVDPGTYAGGVAYQSTSGPAGATVQAGAADYIAVGTYNAATTATTPAVFNGAGYRLLSPPVSGITIADLATKNLVQGVPAGVPASLYPAQYPTATDNLITGFNGTGFLVPASTAVVPQNGRGFFWYWYDQAITPDPASFGGGTSTSRELTGFSLSATGGASTTNVTRQVATSSTGAYMLGNPFAAPFQLSGLTVSLPAGSTLGTVFSVFDPATNSYLTKGPTDYVAVWQGFFAQVTGTTNPVNPTFVYNVASTNPSATPPFYGRGADVADTGVRFRLDGQTAAGETHDLAAQVRFLDDADAGQDRHDGTKLLPPGETFALLAPVVGDERLSVNSLPADLVGVTVPLALRATAAGTFTLTWENTLDGRTATLRDLVTGTTVNLATATEYTFASDAADWTTRFELVLGRGTTAGEAAPAALRVGTFAPNPAAGQSRLTFTSDVAQTVRATVVDALGREVVVLFDAAVTAGTETSLSVEAGRLAPGTYAVRIAGETFSETRRLTVVR